MRIINFLLITIMLISSISFAENGKRYEGPDDSAGDPNLERLGRMNGNRVLIGFKNNTELGDWPRPDLSRWPNNNEGTKQNDGIGLLIGAMVVLQKDTIPVDTPADIQALQNAGVPLDTLYFCQTNYRELMDANPEGTVEWGFHPVAGYFNILSEIPAMSNDSLSWPTHGWPSTGRELKWPGEWNGRFGRGVIYANLECYFVANDAQDLEYLGSDDRVKYYPRGKSNVHIGDIDPSITTQRGEPWGGAGVRVEMRGFQWRNVMVQDAVFWEYSVSNISDYDLPYMTFGYWVDNQIGGDGIDDEAFFAPAPLNMCYAWDIDERGTEGKRPGIQAFAYLESPGDITDDIDNDRDGLLNESRSNPAGTIIGPTDGIYNLADFKSYYRLDDDELKEHWSGDEDQDWVDWDDANDNGKYDDGEFVGNDVGTDGVGPGELNWYGPDNNGTECNHKPDYIPGIGCEPNFAVVDVTESDMLGLTMFRLFPIPPHVPPYTNWFINDESMWEMTSSDSFSAFIANQNIAEVFATGVFPLVQGETERISMAELHAYEDLAGLRSDLHSAPTLMALKRIVQVIYEKDYRFAQPPLMPILKAYPSDGKVILTWDNFSDINTRERLLNGINDFEGYKLYRSTDKFFADAEKITDGFGTFAFKKPIFQCDKIDGKRGFTDFGLYNGCGYYLGEETGLTHTFVDETVENGRTYYYAIVAYDYGISPENLRDISASLFADEKLGIAPSETDANIDIDQAEDVTFIGQNVAIVTPGVNAAGELNEVVFEVNDKGIQLGTGSIVPEVAFPQVLKNKHTYKVKFKSSILPKTTSPDKDDVLPKYEERGLIYTADGLVVYDVTDGAENKVFEDVLITDQDGVVKSALYKSILDGSETVLDDGRNFFHIPTKTSTTDIFDGLVLNVRMDVPVAQYDPENSYWIKGDANITIFPNTDEPVPYTPWDFYIIFSDEPQISDVSTIGVSDENGVRVRNILKNISMNFYVENRSFPPDSTGQYERYGVIVQDVNENGLLDLLHDKFLVGPITSLGRLGITTFAFDFMLATTEEDSLAVEQLKYDNACYKVSYKRPFWQTDSLLFTVNYEESFSQDMLKTDMDKIKVVPNPYVTTNMMEGAVANTSLNQRRRIVFTHIPEECTIQIFTASGVLIDVIHAPEDGLVKFTNSKGIEMGDYNTGSIHWDLLTDEGLEIASGMYFFHVKDKRTGKEKVGKFAVIK